VAGWVWKAVVGFAGFLFVLWFGVFGVLLFVMGVFVLFFGFRIGFVCEK
jgi:hypothetical protein